MRLNDKLSQVLYCIIILALCALGCASSRPKVSSYTPHFTSPVKESQGIKPSDISIALVKPTYAPELASQLRETGEHQYSKLFRNSLGRDIERLLISKGFKIVGPFSDINDMTFPQKKQSDLVLQPIMDFAFQQPQASQREKSSWGNLLVDKEKREKEYVWEGLCSISGFISFEVWEPLSMQKMWIKKVDIEPINQNCSAVGTANYQIVHSNAVGQLLERIYRAAMIKANVYFNGEEMELVKSQSTELRAKKVY